MFDRHFSTHRPTSRPAGQSPIATRSAVHRRGVQPLPSGLPCSPIHRARHVMPLAPWFDVRRSRVRCSPSPPPSLRRPRQRISGRARHPRRRLVHHTAPRRKARPSNRCGVGRPSPPMWRRPPPLGVVSDRIRVASRRIIPVTSLVVVSAPPIRPLVGPKVDVEPRTDELVARPVSNDSSTPRHRCDVPRSSSHPVERPPHPSSVRSSEPSHAVNRPECRRILLHRLQRRRPVDRRSDRRVDRRSDRRARHRLRRLHSPDRAPRPHKVLPSDSPAALVNPSLRRTSQPMILAGPSTISCRDPSRREPTPACQPLQSLQYSQRAIPHQRQCLLRGPPLRFEPPDSKATCRRQERRPSPTAPQPHRDRPRYAGRFPRTCRWPRSFFLRSGIPPIRHFDPARRPPLLDPRAHRTRLRAQASVDRFVRVRGHSIRRHRRLLRGTDHCRRYHPELRRARSAFAVRPVGHRQTNPSVATRLEAPTTRSRPKPWRE